MTIALQRLTGVRPVQKSVDPLELDRAATPLARPKIRVLRGLAQAGLMIAVLAGGVVAMNRVIASAPERTARPFTPPVITVQAVMAEIGRHTPRVSAFGEIVAARSVELRPAVAGEIMSVSERLRVGDQVEAGTVIATIDAFEYEGALVEARANLQQTEAAIREIDARIAAERDQMAAAEEQLQLARDDLTRAEGLNGAVTARQMTSGG
ncbi:MAG: biotin/lipoyl-binding protein [Phyllobacteriaceae bacterium]|nr:biotin/lipoyl-binding protein [Phyllobacteriaceae bacterium]